MSLFKARNLVIDGHRTSVRLEPVIWEALHDIAARRGCSVHQLVTKIERERTLANLTAAIRVFVVEYYRAAATELQAGRGSGASQTSRGGG